MRMTAKAGKMAVALVVTVLAGSVNVERAGRTFSLGVGPERVFGAEEQVDAAGVIEAGRPTYRPKNHEAWAAKGRIVGFARDAPAFTAKALDGKGRVVASFTAKEGAKAYELEWLSPGTYALRVSAEGYETLTVEGLQVKAKNDLFVSLEFTASR